VNELLFDSTALNSPPPTKVLIVVSMVSPFAAPPVAISAPGHVAVAEATAHEPPLAEQ